MTLTAQQQKLYDSMASKEQELFISMNRDDQDLYVTWHTKNPQGSLEVFIERRKRLKRMMNERNKVGLRNMERCSDGTLTPKVSPEERNVSMREFQKI